MNEEQKIIDLIKNEFGNYGISATSKCFECITKVHRQALQAQATKIIAELEGLKPICVCGCDFGDGCLCRENKEGYDKCRIVAIKIVKKYE